MSKPQHDSLRMGEVEHQHKVYPVYLDPKTRCSHSRIIGRQGSGKSQLMIHHIRQDMEAGRGVAVFDPHSELIQDLCQCVPDHRIDEVIVFDPSDKQHPIPFNILSANSPQERETLVSDIVSLFKRQLSTSFGENMEVCLAQALQALLRSPRGGTLTELASFFANDDFREGILATLDPIEDERVLRFWRESWETFRPKPTSKIVARLELLLGNDVLYRLLSSRSNRIDFAKIMDEQKIFFGSMASARIGANEASILGTLLISKLLQAGMSRANQEREDRKECFIYVDEVSELSTISLAYIITRARKYGLALTVAHQNLAQIKDAELSAAIDLCHTQVSFATTEADAKHMAVNFAHFGLRDILNVHSQWPNFECIARVGGSDRDFKLQFTSQPFPKDGKKRAQRVLNASRAKYSTPEPDIATPAPVSEPSPPPTEPTKPEAGRGGLDHTQIQAHIAQLAKNSGFLAITEKRILTHLKPGYGYVDVSVERGSLKIAFEVCDTTSPSWEKDNSVGKALAEGYQHIACVSDHPEKLDALRAILETELSADHLPKVAFLTPDDCKGYISGFAQASGTTVAGTRAGWQIKRSYSTDSNLAAEALLKLQELLGGT